MKICLENCIRNCREPLLEFFNAMEKTDETESIKEMKPKRDEIWEGKIIGFEELYGHVLFVPDKPFPCSKTAWLGFAFEYTRPFPKSHWTWKEPTTLWAITPIRRIEEAS